MTSNIFVILVFCVSVFKLFSNFKFVFVVAIVLESYQKREFKSISCTVLKLLFV